MYLLGLLDLYNWLFITFVCLFIRMGKKEIWQFMKLLVGIVNLDNIFHSEHNYCLHLQERWLQYMYFFCSKKHDQDHVHGRVIHY
jgi:hypothetical protein